MCIPYTYLSEGIFLRSFRSRPQQSKRPFRRVPSVPLHYPPLSAYFQLSPFFLTAAGRLPLQTCHLEAFCGLLAAFFEAHFDLLVSIPGPSDPPVVPQQSVCCQVFPFFSTAALSLPSPVFSFVSQLCQDVKPFDEIKLARFKIARKDPQVPAQETCYCKNQSDQESRRPYRIRHQGHLHL